MINNKLELKYKSYERGKCPCCQSINYRELFNSKIKKSDLNLLKKIYNNNIDKIRFGNNELISLVKCKSCDLIYHKKIPKKETLNLIYSNLISNRKSFKKYEKSKKIRISKAKKLLQRLKRTLRIFQKINYLDFGFGWGAFLIAGKELNLNTFGIETNDLQLKSIKSKKIKIFNNIGNLIKNESINFKFSLITLNQVLEHLVDPLTILSDLRKISHKNSLLYISVPEYISKHSIQKKDVFIKGALQPFEHLNCFSRRSINYLAKNSGWIFLSHKNIFKNFGFIFRNYNFIFVILLASHSLIKKGVFYLIPNKQK